MSEISFGFQLASAPTAHFINAGAMAPAECAGTALAPSAAPGHLCVYEGSSLNAGGRNTNVFGSGDGFSLATGAGLFVRSAAAGDFYTRGTWAVTAP